MSFKEPFRAVPLKLGNHYAKKERYNGRIAVARMLGLAAMVGVIVGFGSVLLDENRRADIAFTLKPVAVHLGIARAREPRAGDFWGGCDDARAVGTAPIYSNEPGYREDMDGDGDGVACEPYR